MLETIFNFFTTIGGLVSIPILTVLTFDWIIWQKRYYWVWLLVIGVAVGIGINLLLKAFYHRPRPELWVIRHLLDTTSLPSGHATASFCYFSILAWFGLSTFKSPILRIVWTILMLLIIVMVGLSRIYLGVHYPTDVLGAWLSAGIWLAILLNRWPIYRRWQKRPPIKAIPEDTHNK